MRYLLLASVWLLLNYATVCAGDSLIVSEAWKEILISGYTRNVNSQTISSETEGKVMKVNYDVGQIIVDKPFVELDTTFIDYDIESAQRSLDKLEVIIKKATSSVTYLEKEYLRTVSLFKDDLATEAVKDSAEQQLEQSMFELESALSEKAVINNTLNELKARKKRLNIYAPAGWVVIYRNIEEGEVVMPGSALAKAADYREMVVPLSVSTIELSAIESLPSSFDAKIEGLPVKASINWVNPEFDEKTRKLKIELLIDNYSGIKRGGLQFTVPLPIKTEGLYVPKDAVFDRYENPSVTLKKSGSAVQILVIGETGNNLIVVEDERLEPGAELVRTGMVN